ncbi:beta-ketoacyl-ACP synthase [Brevundimonas sp. FT23042]|uniref:beta-ketoacyl-ACP synthase n=1 Tax=Brevundimonas sp. FT23042 TaxID=3393749 RepID=UPI003B58A45D
MTRRVVVTGMAGVTALGGEWSEIERRMRAGETGTRRIAEWERLVDLTCKVGAPADWFVHEGRYHRQKSRSMGRVGIMAVDSVERALAQAGLTDDPVLKNGRTGVACGSSFGSTGPIKDFVHFLDTGKAGALNATSYIRMMAHTAAVNISVFFGLTGRVITTSSACTSGSQGVGYGYETILHNQADIMIVGGTEEFCPSMAMVFDRLYATSSNGNDTPDSACRPFEASRDGMVTGEGAGFLILEEREHALARGATILAEVTGFATNADGAHISHPAQETQERVMRQAMEMAGIGVSDIAFISGHGTATVAGDVVESQATQAVYGKDVPFHTLKGHFGHSLGACGGIEAWLGVEMLRTGWISPIANFHEHDPRCAELDYVGVGGRVIHGDYFVSNNFAFGGINTSLVFKRA